MAAGALWNSGLFAWTAARLLAEVELAHARGGPRAPRARRAATSTRFFREVTPISIDVGLLERSRRGRGGAGATSPGTTSAPGRRWPGCGPRTPGATCVVGDGGRCTRAQDCVVWSDGDPIVLYGVQELVVVQANGRILVMPAERAASMKQLLDALPPAVRDTRP